MGPNTDRICQCSGVTTLCDAGSAGSSNFAGLRQLLDGLVRTRVRALVNLSAIGITGTSRGGELQHFPYADPEGCARTIKQKPDIAFGVKLRFGPNLVWEYSAAPVKLARKTADMAGGVPIPPATPRPNSANEGCPVSRSGQPAHASLGEGGDFLSQRPA